VMAIWSSVSVARVGCDLPRQPPVLAMEVDYADDGGQAEAERKEAERTARAEGE
jgi:hypothetical protein